MHAFCWESMCSIHPAAPCQAVHLLDLQKGDMQWLLAILGRNAEEENMNLKNTVFWFQLFWHPMHDVQLFSEQGSLLSYQICALRYWLGNFLWQTGCWTRPGPYHVGCHAGRLRHWSFLLNTCNVDGLLHVLTWVYGCQSFTVNVGKADSARHVVSMGQLFSRLRTPSGGHFLAVLDPRIMHVSVCACGCGFVIFIFCAIWHLGTSDLLSNMKSWTCQSNWSRNLHKLIYKFNMTLPVEMVSVDLPVKWKNQHVMMPWPVLPFSSWLKCIFKRTKGQPVLAGYTLDQEDSWKTMFQNFWDKFRRARGEYHPVFEDHAQRLEVCLPIFIHGDEGRGKLRRAVLATSVQPVLVSEGHAGHTFNSRFLHSIMPGEHYEGDSTVQILQETLVEDLQNLYTHGCDALGFQFEQCFPVAIFGKHACMLSFCGSCLFVKYVTCQVTTEDGRNLRIFVVLVGTKGDWVYLRALVVCACMCWAHDMHEWQELQFADMWCLHEAKPIL